MLGISDDYDGDLDIYRTSSLRMEADSDIDYEVGVEEEESQHDEYSNLEDNLLLDPRFDLFNDSSPTIVHDSNVDSDVNRNLDSKVDVNEAFIGRNSIYSSDHLDERMKDTFYKDDGSMLSNALSVNDTVDAKYISPRRSSGSSSSSNYMNTNQDLFGVSVAEAKETSFRVFRQWTLKGDELRDILYTADDGDKNAISFVVNPTLDVNLKDCSDDDFHFADTIVMRNNHLVNHHVNEATSSILSDNRIRLNTTEDCMSGDERSGNSDNYNSDRSYDYQKNKSKDSTNEVSEDFDTLVNGSQYSSPVVP